MRKPVNKLQNKKKTNSVPLVCNRTIPTERPSRVAEVSAIFSGRMVSRGQRKGSPRPLISAFYTGVNKVKVNQNDALAD
jgi:hypothetical protein